MKISQKDLFNKTAVTKVKQLLDRSGTVIYIYGPIGCGKTTTVEVLCKNWDILKIDPDHIRRAELTEKIIKDLSNSCGNMTWTEILSKGKKTEKKKVVLIDGIDLCERTIRSFLESIPDYVIKEIPIILISSECIRGVSNLSFISSVIFNKPSLLELCKLIEKESNDSNLINNRESMEELVNRSEFDTRQLLNLIQNRCPSNASKIRDYDLEEKTLMILGPDYSLDKSFLLGSSEPSVLTGSIFNNYLHSVQGKDQGKDQEQCIVALTDKMTISNSDTNLERLSHVMDSISFSDTMPCIDGIGSWETTDVVTVFGCVVPSYYSTGLSKLDYSNQTPSTICSLRSKEEIILSNWIKWGAYEKFVDYIKEKRFYKVTIQNEKKIVDFSLPKGVKIKLTRIQRSKICKMIEESLAKKSESENTEKIPPKETVVNLQWFKMGS